MIVVSTGCPAGIGPEVSVAAAAALRAVHSVLVGDLATLRAAANVVGIAEKRIVPVESARAPANAIRVLGAGPKLSAADRRRGKPTKRAGAAQLEYIEAAYRFAKAEGAALVSGPVSKAAIAHSGAPGASRFRGHTEWLRDLDRAPHAIMCFVAPGLATSLVTTHLPLAKVPAALTKESVRDATVELGRLLAGIDRKRKRPIIAVASLNPHAGESELLGGEENSAILPGLRLARVALGRRADVRGPVGAETAYRLMRAGKYDGVVAMYHDQATIPMKLVAFGDAVNVTMGLSVVRTSVDHGTAYDIAWTGKADAGGMMAAMTLAERLGRARGGSPLP
jgi:4-hydroxythreonine-4-phosphate dehydrogenase